MGYAQSGLKTGYSLVTPQFLSISTEAMPLESISATGDEASDNVEIQTLDAFGYTVDSYVWNDWVSETPCWVDGDYNPVEGVTFAAGQGLWVGGTPNNGLQSAGKVGSEDVTFTLRTGYIAAGNPFPVSVDLQDIVAVGDETSDNVEIQTLDAFGYTVDSYVWNDWVSETPCWVDGDYNPVEGVTFVAGQGLWIGGASTEQAVRFPAPEL